MKLDFSLYSWKTAKKMILQVPARFLNWSKWGDGHYLPLAYQAVSAHLPGWKEGRRQANFSGKVLDTFICLLPPPCLKLLRSLNHSPAPAARQASIKPWVRWKALSRCIIQSSEPCTEHVIRINVCARGWTCLCATASSHSVTSESSFAQILSLLWQWGSQPSRHLFKQYVLLPLEESFQENKEPQTHRGRLGGCRSWGSSAPKLWCDLWVFSPIWCRHQHHIFCRIQEGS